MISIYALTVVWASASVPPARALEVPRFAEFRSAHRGSETLYLDRAGKPLGSLRGINEEATRSRKGEWKSLDEISPALIEAVVHAEDRRFWDHSGVDLRALLRAGIQASRDAAAGSALRGGGASTISMQLVDLLAADPRLRKKRRSSLIDGVRLKSQQILSASELDGEWSKQEILEAYLNLVPFRGEHVGIDAASRAIFGKSPIGLSAAESAVLAVMIRSPNAPWSVIEQRACRHMESVEPLEGACRLPRLSTAARGHASSSQPLAYHYLRTLRAHQTGAGGLLASMSTPLDSHIQQIAEWAVQDQLAQLKDQNVTDASVLVLDLKTAQVRAYVGSGGKYSYSPHVDGVRARRQAGSTLKPFLYGLAFEKKLIQPDSILEDSAVEIPISGGVYRPRNYDDQFKGAVRAYQALGASLNAPAVKLLEMVGVEEFWRRLSLLGFSGMERPEFYGPSLALGSIDVSLWDLTHAYRSLALSASGRRGSLAGRLNPDSSAQVLSILSAAEARAMTFGLESVLSGRSWLAAKTGTSKDMRDNWCMGVSDRYAVGVWVGNFGGLPMHDVSGVSGAAPIWARVMAALHSESPSRAAPWVRPMDPQLEAGPEVFASILSPTDGERVALDPDIPVDLQKITLKTRGAREGDRLRVYSSEGTLLLDEAPESEPEWFPPARGRYEVRLVSPEGVNKDSAVVYRR